MTVDYEKSGKEREIYNLWWEYLKRSKDYKEYCEFQRRKNIETHAPKKFQVNVKRGYIPPVTIAYHWFGDVHVNSFEKWWEFHQRKATNEAVKIVSDSIIDYSDVVTQHMEICIDSFIAQKGRTPTLDEFTFYFSDYMKSDKDGFIYLWVNPWHAPIKEMTKRFEEIVTEQKRNIPQIQKIELALEKYRKPSSLNRIRLDELKRYLQVYDLRNRGLKWNDIIKKLNRTDDKAIIEIVRVEFHRYLRKAKAIIKNVERGIFPGEY